MCWKGIWIHEQARLPKKSSPRIARRSTAFKLRGGLFLYIFYIQFVLYYVQYWRMQQNGYGADLLRGR